MPCRLTQPDWPTAAGQHSGYLDDSDNATCLTEVISMPVVVTILTAMRPASGGSNGADLSEVSASRSSSSMLRPTFGGASAP